MLLDVQGLTTHILADTGVVRAVEDVALTVNRGEAVALVGESGCGKSMTALSLMRLVSGRTQTLGGRIMFEGQDLLALSEREMRRLRGGRLAMIFQDPMTYLNPLMRVGDQIVEALRLHQTLSPRAARAAAVEALAMVRIPSPQSVFSVYPHQLSGGMRQRVLIAMAISSHPSLLIADEPTTALDVTIQAQIMELLHELRHKLGSALLLITHDLGLVREYCDRVYVMYAGRIVEQADTARLFEVPQHPYTKALLRSTLSPRRKTDVLVSIQGQPPNLARLPYGCAFRPRCDVAIAKCAQETPPLFAVAGWHSRCWHAEAAR